MTISNIAPAVASTWNTIEAFLTAGAAADPRLLTDALDNLGGHLPLDDRQAITHRVNDWLASHGHHYEVSIIDDDLQPVDPEPPLLSASCVWPVFETFLLGGAGDDPQLILGALVVLSEFLTDADEQQLHQHVNAWLAGHGARYGIRLDGGVLVLVDLGRRLHPRPRPGVPGPLRGEVIDEPWVETLPDTDRLRFRVQRPDLHLVQVEVFGDRALEVAGVISPGVWVEVDGPFVGDVLRADAVQVIPRPS